MKIRAKLSITYLTVSLSALLCMGLFIYFYVKNTLTSEVLSHLESVSSIQSHRIEGIIEQNLERVRLVSSRTQLRISLHQYLQSADMKHFTKLNRILNDALTSISSFRVISLLDKEGNVVASTKDSYINKSYGQHEFFDTAHKENSAEHFFLDADNNLKLYLSGPLEFNGIVIGILLIESDAQNIVSLVGDYSGLGQTGETVLGRKSYNGKSAQYLVPLRFDSGAALYRIVEFTNKLNPMVMALSKKGKLSGTGIDYRNNEVLVATTYIESTDWGLVVKIDKHEAFEPINDLLKYILIISLILIFIIAWVSFVLADIIGKPVVDLTETANHINQGDLVQRAVVSSNDEVGQLARTFNDMTDGLIRTQQELENSNAALQDHRDHLEDLVAKRTHEIEAKSKELEAFSYSVSHDLRSPLRAIDGFSQILVEDYGDVIDADGRKLFQRIRQACQHMGQLIDDLLKLSRTNRSEIERRNVDLSIKANTVIERLDAGQSDRQVEFIVEPNLNIYGDETLMEVVMTNLLRNAWKYSSNREVARIEVGKVEKNGEPVFYVRDNGIGFDMKYEHKIFETFQRLVTRDEYSGTGIGLAIVSRVINRHGGKIWAESEPDKGATFYFTVPPAV